MHVTAATILLLLTTLPLLARAGGRPGLVYLEQVSELCRWTAFDLDHRSKLVLLTTPCPGQSIAFDLAARRYLYVKGAAIFEVRGERPRPVALPRPPTGGTEIERVWLDRSGAVRAAYLEPVRKQDLFRKNENEYYRYEGRVLKLDGEIFGGMAVGLKLEGTSWKRVEVVPSFGSPDDSATTAPLRDSATGPGTHSASVMAARGSGAKAAKKLAAEWPAAARLIKAAYEGADPERIAALTFGTGSALLAYTTSYGGHTGPVYLCRERCTRSKRLFDPREDDFGSAVLSRSGTYVYLRYLQDLVVFADQPGLTPLLWLRQPKDAWGAFETWVNLPASRGR